MQYLNYLGRVSATGISSPSQWERIFLFAKANSCVLLEEESSGYVTLHQCHPSSEKLHRGVNDMDGCYIFLPKLPQSMV